tara:strand:- start:1016 stop:1372 length:357 start_codon:yes stop_codon:yes gene_type:complete
MSAKQLESRVAQLEQLVATLHTKADAISSTESSTKVKKEKSTVNKDGTPKKPKAKTGYLVFSSEKREDIKKMLEEESGEAPKPKDVISKLGAVWKALSDDEKKVFNDKAKAMAEEATE